MVDKIVLQKIRSQVLGGRVDYLGSGGSALNMKVDFALINLSFCIRFWSFLKTSEFQSWKDMDSPKHLQLLLAQLQDHGNIVDLVVLEALFQVSK